MADQDSTPVRARRASPQDPIRVLFICLGNICRSPMAEAIMQHLVAEAGLTDKIVVDSVGTGDWHVGQPAHRGTREVLQRHGVSYSGVARQITVDDLSTPYLIAMDRQNLADARALDPTGLVASRLSLLLDYGPPGGPRDVPDPYYTGDFDTVYHLIDAACQGLLKHIREKHDL